MNKPLNTSKTPKELMRVAGFCFALAATILLIKVIISVQSPDILFPGGILGVLLVALCMLVVSMLNDFFCSALGGKVLNITMFIGCTLAPLGYALFDYNAIFLPLIVAGIAVSILLWGRLLAYLDHQYLYFVSSIAFIFSGFTVMFTLGIGYQLLLVIVAGFYLVALICEILFKEDQAQQAPIISAEDSRNRNIPGRGNRFTLFTIGLVSGISMFLISQYSQVFEAVSFVGGGIIMLSGLLVLLAAKKYRNIFEDVARRSIALCAALALLPLSFMPLVVQVILIVILLVSACINLIILISAIAETSRKRQISPIWLFGSEGAMFMLGLWAGIAGFWLSFTVLEHQLALTLACTLSVILIINMQVFIENQTYPFFDEKARADAAEDDDYYVDTRHFTHKGGAIWREKLDMVTANYNLSPRQSEVMELLVKGRDAKYIMDYFVVSRSTAKTHTYNLYKKLGIHSRQELLNLVEQTNTRTSLAE